MTKTAISSSTPTSTPTTAETLLALARKIDPAVLQLWPPAAALVVVRPAAELVLSSSVEARADIGHLSYVLWDEVRGLSVAPDGLSLDVVLGRAALASAPPLALRGLLVALLRGGDFLRAAEAERDRYNEVIREYSPLRTGR